jgi:hypothetical protein
MALAQSTPYIQHYKNIGQNNFLTPSPKMLPALAH